MPPGAPVAGFAEVQDCLVKGGYFRARIQALPPFDIVAGGLAWCIRYSRFTIDVEFVENAEIRDKIKAAENICAALHGKMHCPHPLEPHQIQGLDYPKLLIVLQWLMKRVASTREENAFFVREFTKQDYRRRFGCHFPGTKTVKRAKPKPAPARVMISQHQEYKSAVEHVTAVLLEYGMESQVKDSVLMMRSNAAEFEGDAEAQQEHQKLEEEERKEAAMMESLMSQMVQHKERARMSASSVNSVLASADTNKLNKLRDAYNQRHQQLMEQLKQEEQERNELENQKERSKEVRERAEELKSVASQLSDDTEAYRAMVESKKQEAEAQDEELAGAEARVEEVERVMRGDPVKSKQLDKIIKLRQTLKTEQKSLKEQKSQSKKQIAAMKAECEALAAKLEAVSSAEHNDQLTSEVTKYDAQKNSLVEALREATMQSVDVLRKIDMYPTRLELKQYETRIDELNEEVAWKFEETKLMFAMHNTRTEVAKTLAGEQKVFDSVSEAFLSCVAAGPKKSASQRSNLLEQVGNVVKQLSDTQVKQQAKLAQESEALNQLQAQYNDLMQKQKQYFEAVANFKERAAAIADMTPEERKAIYGDDAEEDLGIDPDAEDL